MEGGWIEDGRGWNLMIVNDRITDYIQFLKSSQGSLPDSRTGSLGPVPSYAGKQQPSCEPW